MKEIIVHSFACSGKSVSVHNCDVEEPMELKEYLSEEWKSHNVDVVPVSNFNTLALRSLIKDISKFYDVPFNEVNAVTGAMLYEAMPKAKEAHGITAGVYEPTFDEVMEYSESLQKFLMKYPEIANHINNLKGQNKSTSRHAGGVCIGENISERMPLIRSGGVTQTPWMEGLHARQLEPMGFLKFDLLGLATLRMIRGTIENILRNQGVEEPTITNVREFYEEYLHPDKINLDDQRVYKHVFQEGNFVGTFQFTQKNAQAFCMAAKPTCVDDLSAITAIYRPGPLGSNIDREYLALRNGEKEIEKIHPLMDEALKKTNGLVIYQEDIAKLAHVLGDGISLAEGNKLRKLLIKKGLGEVGGAKQKIHDKFVRGCVQKGIDGRELWEEFEKHAQYSFAKNHAIPYSIISYQCAYLFTYHPIEWCMAFLDKEPEDRKEAAINLVKGAGFTIKNPDINESDGINWTCIEKDGERIMVQPLYSIKGLGEKAIAEIIKARPFSTLEDLLFNEKISYTKLNKKALDVLIRSGALNCLMDSRFINQQHFWISIVPKRPQMPLELTENINEYLHIQDFSMPVKIESMVSLTGIFPFDWVMAKDVINRLHYYRVPMISEYDDKLQLAWFIPRDLEQRKTKNDKEYWIITVIDPNGANVRIKCWGITPRDRIFLNRPYMAKINHEDRWGFSIRKFSEHAKLLG